MNPQQINDAVAFGYAASYPMTWPNSIGNGEFAVVGSGCLSCKTSIRMPRQRKFAALMGPLWIDFPSFVRSVNALKNLFHFYSRLFGLFYGAEHNDDSVSSVIRNTIRGEPNMQRCAADDIVLILYIHSALKWLCLGMRMNIIVEWAIFVLKWRREKASSAFCFACWCWCWWKENNNRNGLTSNNK